MSNTRVSAIRLPGLRDRWRSEPLARQTVFSVLGRLQVGSLTVQEGGETIRFGDAETRNHPSAVVNIHDPLVYKYVLTGGSVGSGEAYMLGHWSSPDLVSVVRLFCANMAVLNSMDSSKSLWNRIGLQIAHLVNSNTLRGSRRNISAHYDLGNDFFSLFLDSTMMYSAAVFPSPAATLEEASLHKMDVICAQLELQPSDHLLEIGTGWGGMALHAARQYGCLVTTTTLSQQQYEYTLQRVRNAGLAHRVRVLCCDYRDLEGKYDKLVSIEMIEAVGYEFFQHYFKKCAALLKPCGLMVLQAITVADQRYEQTKKEVDFIKRYIFPGGCLPSLVAISRHVAKDTDMQITHLRDITRDYAATLAHWRARFQAALLDVYQQGFDEEFARMWEFYLSYCEGGFRERVISTVQLTLAKPDYRF